ncbi:hypothetical protein AB0F72_14135 [Actinoplanes sp. NPDC023936]|uniref:hypothetical protein n=1 Tax=Actinoplanes sp. NPDC023936 TaxID=3154910 RepID=UPI0033F93299
MSAQPISRRRLFGAELLATTGGAVALVTLAGLAMWTGIAAAGGGLDVLAALQGAWNTLPIVLLSLAAAALAAGWAPRLAALLGALPATGGFLLLVMAESIDAPTWVREVSPFAHLAPVPLQSADWLATTTMIGIAAATTVLAVVGYQRRDLRC